MILEVAGRKVGNAVDVRNAVQAADDGKKMIRSGENIVDLLFLTGGGTRGLAAYAIAQRCISLLGAGVSVIMRYTLRLLTLHLAVAYCRETVDPSRRRFTAAAVPILAPHRGNGLGPRADGDATLSIPTAMAMVGAFMKAPFCASDWIGELGLPWRIGGSRSAVSWP